MEKIDIFNVSFDRVTIVGNISKDLEFALDKISNDSQNQIYKAGESLLEVKVFSYAEGSGSAYLKYDAIMAKAMDKRNLRIEFNPNMLSASQLQYIQENVCSLLDDVAFSRLDIAFDCDVDLSKYVFEKGTPTKRITHEGKDRAIETIYIGSSSSDLQIRIYNKRREMLAKGQEVDLDTFWRLEFELKNSTSNSLLIDRRFPLFDDLRIIRHDLNMLPIREKAILTALIEHPEYLSEFSKGTKAKYNKMLRSLGGDDITPMFEEALHKKMPELIAQINSWQNAKQILVSSKT